MIKKRQFRYLLALIIIGICGLAVMSGCAPQAPEEPMPEPVVVAPAPPPEPEPEPEPDPLPMLPLSGIEVEEGDPLLNQKPLSVKIENTPESRPALGITLADVVYETITEGGITRFNALFHSQMPEAAGSVRSARNSDLSIVPQYEALFVFSGTNSLVWAGIPGTISSLIEEGTAGKALYRIGHKSAPHNLYLNTELAFARFEERGCYLTTQWPRGLMFGDIDASGFGDRDDAIEVFVPFSGSAFDVTWTYDPDRGRYLRYIRGAAQNDEGYGQEQIVADNIIMLSIPYVPAPDVPGKGQTYNMDFNGSGSAIIFRDGVRIDCTWETDGTHPPHFKDASGEYILLKPGKTWFQVPRDIFATVVMTGHAEYDDPEAAVSEETDEDAMNAANAADVNE